MSGIQIDFFATGNVILIIVAAISALGAVYTIYQMAHLKTSSKQGKTSKIVWLIGCILAVLVMLFSIFRLFYTRVPNLVSKDLITAIVSLEKAELNSNISSHHGGESVISEQSIEPGAYVPKGKVIEVKVSVVVPDVTDILYKSASDKLAEVGLKGGLIYGGENLYVIEQVPEAGVWVDEGSVVKLTTDSIGNNEEYRQETIDSYTGEFGGVSIKFRDTSIQLWSDENSMECFGNMIDDPEIQELYLKNVKDGVEYHTYTESSNEVIFEDIPYGEEYELYIDVAKYEILTDKIDFSQKNTIDGKMSIIESLIPNGNAEYFPAEFLVFDKNIKPFDGARVYVEWEENIMYGPYAITSDGGIDGMILVNEDIPITVIAYNPYGDGIDYECEISLEKTHIGEAMDGTIVVLQSDGSCKAVKESDYYSW